MLKLVCGQNFVLFGHSGHELQRFEKFSFLVNLYGIVAAVIFTMQRHIPYKYKLYVFTYG